LPKIKVKSLLQCKIWQNEEEGRGKKKIKRCIKPRVYQFAQTNNPHPELWILIPKIVVLSFKTM
jgi:hypothetical protein